MRREKWNVTTIMVMLKIRVGDSTSRGGYGYY